MNRPLANRARVGFCFAISCCLLATASRLPAVTVVLPASHDASIFQNNPDNASGGGNALVSGTNGSISPRRGLLAFDVAGNVPAGATIQSAELTMYLAQFAGSGGGGNGVPTAAIDLHRITSPWGEGVTQRRDPPDDSLNGIGQGAPAAVGDVTWNERSFGATPQQSWLQPGGDFDSTVSSSATVDTTIDAAFTWPSTATLLADVQNWLANPTTNFGWMLVNKDETSSRTFRAFYSREVATVEHRPGLTISYTLPANPSADFNGNHLVDGADFLIWQRGQGIAVGASPATGDANGDGAVNTADLAIWKQQYGASPPAVSVPEPTSMATCGFALAVLVRLRHRRQSTAQPH